MEAKILKFRRKAGCPRGAKQTPNLVLKPHPERVEEVIRGSMLDPFDIIDIDIFDNVGKFKLLSEVLK